MPDKWEYPWYAAWDLAFHTIALALVDPDFAKEQLDPLPPRVVHAPERPDTRLRVGLRRRQPAGPRLGGLARLQDREADPRGRRPAIPRAGLPEAAPQLHLVGEPQGPRGEERLPGRLPRPRQHRGVRPVGAAPRGRAPRAIRRHRVGRDVLPEHAGDRARAGRGQPGLRGHGVEVPGALRLHRPRDERHAAARGSSSGTRRTASSTTSSTCRTDGHAAQGPLAGGAGAALRGAGPRAGGHRPAAAVPAAHGVVPAEPGRSRRTTSCASAGPTGGRGGSCRW